MLFKSHSEYEPDAGCDDGVEAVEAAPTSEARLRLSKLLTERSEAESEAQRAKDSLAKLASAQSLAAPFEQQLAMLSESESQSLRRWSELDSDAPPPAPNVEARLELERKIAERRSTADAAKRAMPSLEASYLRASNRVAAIKGAIDATIAEIVLEEIGPAFAEIVQAKATIAAMIARAEHGREFALRGLESIPHPNRLAVAAPAYAALAAVDKRREAALANPPPSYDTGPWRDLASRLVHDASATVEG